ncbi:MAG: ABC-type uncharacterized transport system [Proteobacteria bacterium]|nr:ABC-type uncharacterized transport system [Pseudomonadota bacterium]
MTLNRKTLTGSALGLLAVLFVALVLLSNTLLRGARLDLTQQGLYTLSKGTRNILGKLDEHIHLSLYFSDKATAESNRADVRGLRLYFDRVRELLEEMGSRSGGKVELEVIDPLPYSEAEDRANAAGLQGIPLGPSGEMVFLGLAGSNATDGQVVIPFFDPGKESFLEYDVATLIHDLTTTRKPTVGLLSGLPMSSGPDPTGRGMREPWAVHQQLSQLFEVKSLNAADLKAVDKDINLLVVVHPKELTEDAQYAIDQFVLRGGHLLVFVDPNADMDEGRPDPRNPMAAMMASRSSDLAALFKSWGVEYSPSEVVLDRVHALAVSTSPGTPPARHPAILRFGKRDLQPPLLESSDQAMTVPPEQIRFVSDPSSLLADFKPTGERYILAGRLEGKFKTAFPARSGPDHLAEAKESGEILLVADTDMLTDRLWVRTQSFFGQKLLNSFADNGDWFINAVDTLAGSSDLIGIRGRGSSSRPFTRVDELRLAADDRFRVKEQELQGELADTERKLADLQSGKSKDDKFVLSPEQQQELENFLERKLQIRKELREVRRQLDADIDALGARLKFLNIALVPLLLTLVALGAWVWKAKKIKRPEEKSA